MKSVNTGADDVSAIEDLQRQFWSYPGPLSESGALVTYADLMAALAEAWSEGFLAPDDSRLEDNPYKENS